MRKPGNCRGGLLVKEHTNWLSIAKHPALKRYIQKQYMH